jgi:hypothetical protein
MKFITSHMTTNDAHQKATAAHQKGKSINDTLFSLAH